MGSPERKLLKLCLTKGIFTIIVLIENINFFDFNAHIIYNNYKNCLPKFTKLAKTNYYLNLFNPLKKQY